MIVSYGYGVAIWILAIIFAWSGIAKLWQPTLAARALVDFGVLRRVRPHLGSALGVAELSLALLLMAGTLPDLSLPITAGLLWLFVLLISKSLWTGDRFACFCFGQADSKLSHLTLLRTTALALLASVLAITLPPTAVYGSFSDTYVLQATSAMALVGTIVLGSQIPKLLPWNQGSYVIGKIKE